MKIVIATVHIYPSPQAFPLAGAFLKAAAAELPGVEVTLLDLFLTDAVEQQVAQLLAAAPDAVGFPLYVWNRGRVEDLAAELKWRRPGTILFAGGPETGVGSEALLRAGRLDWLAVGEGEETFREAAAAMAAGRPVHPLSGVATLAGDRLRLVPRPALRELDRFASPFRAVDPGSYPGVLWQLSRGCGFGCDFCLEATSRAAVRLFSEERIVEEARLLTAAEVAQVFVLDSTFNRDPARAKKILRLLRRHAPQIHFHFEVRSEFLDRELARLFAEIPCSLQIGLQSASARVLANVGRRFDADDFRRKAMLLNESGAVFGFDLIYGLPGDTLQGFRDSLDFALSLYPNHLDIFPLAVLPGTRLASRAAEFGLHHAASPPYLLQDSPGFSRHDMAAAERLARACDIFYSRGKAVAWFNAMLRGLGKSPSSFLHEFGEWFARGQREVREEALTDREIQALQETFLGEIFRSKGKQKLLPPLMDVVRYHHQYARALVAPPLRGQKPGANLLGETFVLVPAAGLGEFSYDIVELLKVGEPDLEEIRRHLRPVQSWAAIYPAEGEVRTETMAEPFFRLLQGCDGTRTAGTLAREAGLAAQEAGEFLRIALDEGIIARKG